MKKKLIIVIGLALLVHSSAYAINKTYRKQLERSGCTQVTEAQGCDITKTKAQNAKAGFGSVGPSHAKPISLHGIKGMDQDAAIDEMERRGFKGVDSLTSGKSFYGIYYSGATGQCIQVTNADHKVYSVDDIKTHPKCR